MASDEPRRRDDGNDKPKKWQCCVCRSTKEHRCYKCFCEKCPSYNKKIPPRYGVNDPSYSRPSNSSSALPRSEERKVSESVPMDTSAKQSVEIKDQRTGDEQPLGFSSDKDGDQHTKAISPNLDPLIVEKQKGKDEVGKKSNEVDGGSSKSNAGSTSIWEILAAKEPKAPRKQEEQVNRDGPGSSWVAKKVEEPRNQAGWGNAAGKTVSWGVPRASGNQAVWANKVGASASYGTWHANESRGNASGSFSSRDQRRERDPRSNAERSVSSWDTRKEHKPKSNAEISFSSQDSPKEREPRSYADRSVSSRDSPKEREPRSYADRFVSSRDSRKERDPRRNADRSDSNRDSRKECEPRRNADRSNSCRDSRKEHEQRGNVDRSISSWDPRIEHEPRSNAGNEEITSTRAQDRSSKPASPIKRAISGSRLDSDTRKRSRDDQQRVTYKSEDMASSPVKKRRGFQEIVVNSKTTRDGFSKTVLPSHAVESDRSRIPCTSKQSRENPEVKPCRAGAGSAEPDLLNHHEPSKKMVSLAVGNQEMMNGKTEQGSSAAVPALAANKSTGYPVSGKNLVPDGEYVAETVPKNIQVIRENKKTIDPAISPRQAKPPPVVICRQNSSSKQKCHDSEVEDLSCPSSRDLVGPAKEVIWKGCFEFLKFTGNTISESYLAHLAAKVNVEAHKFVSQISGHLQLKMHPVTSFWPNLFIIEQPDARDIALYFYPENSERSTKEYKYLLHTMSEQDMMLRSSMEGVDLLIFSSKLLKRHHRRLKGRSYYMWGVFRQLGNNEFPKVVQSPHLGPTQADGQSK